MVTLYFIVFQLYSDDNYLITEIEWNDFDLWYSWININFNKSLNIISFNNFSKKYSSICHDMKKFFGAILINLYVESN
ncbi:hypothetical protein J2Z62_000425 [Mycoplasmoides fastidiosum]|uniref:Uncharacterized protein n=1 Tax=Mycoplasmoides fastidiosum TaxID=92758 RepID=A0ABU0LZ58_9BACT|nr:hypothetical protein [Mycoplasmoides fastidiosum]